MNQVCLCIISAMVLPRRAGIFFLAALNIRSDARSGIAQAECLGFCYFLFVSFFRIWRTLFLSFMTPCSKSLMYFRALLQTKNASPPMERHSSLHLYPARKRAAVLSKTHTCESLMSRDKDGTESGGEDVTLCIYYMPHIQFCKQNSDKFGELDNFASPTQPASADRKTLYKEFYRSLTTCLATPMIRAEPSSKSETGITMGW